MWLSGQYKRPADSGEGQTGIVTMSGGELAVMLDSERRGLEVYAPAGYRWTPQKGQRVLVIQGQGERPCVAGVRQGGARPGSVGIAADSVGISGNVVSISGSVGIWGGLTVNGKTLEQIIAEVLAGMMGGSGR